MSDQDKSKTTNTEETFDRTVYYVNRKRRFFSWKVALLAVVIVALCCYAYQATLDHSITTMQDNAIKAEKKLLKKAASEGEPVSIAPTLRKDTVSRVIEDQSIPAYSYDQCWSLDVSKPSGVSLADLQLVSRGAFVGIEDAFLKAEQDYGINCLFVMAIASLESANGTMCFKPNNMFGFGSRGFSSKSECVDVVARSLEYNYLTPGGSLYNGTRITDVNKRYAASSTWDNKVCRNMARYYAAIAPAHNAQLEKLK